MIISAVSIDQSGPGIDLSEQPDGVSIQMSDPVQDLEYARNAVTLTFDLSWVEHVRLAFKAMEYGDEPHFPKDEGGIEKDEGDEGAFGPVADFDFDGVAISADGVDWYEIQGLRNLRSDTYTAFDIDLDAAIAGLGLSYTNAFRIRFCQYDDNPAPMDGISIQGIVVDGDGLPPWLRLTMDDNAATAAVVDAGTGIQNQTFVDPTGNPNTSAHTAAGKEGTALSFDGVDDRVHLTSASYAALLGAGHDFSIAFWWKTNAPNPASTLHTLSNYQLDTENSIHMLVANGNVYLRARFGVGVARTVGQTWIGGADDAWHHYVLTRKGTVLSFYRDGVLALTNDHPDNSLSLAPVGVSLTIGSRSSGSQASPGFADDFRVYDRALWAEEIAQLQITN